MLLSRLDSEPLRYRGWSKPERPPHWELSQAVPREAWGVWSARECRELLTNPGTPRLFPPSRAPQNLPLTLNPPPTPTALNQTAVRSDG